MSNKKGEIESLKLPRGVYVMNPEVSKLLEIKPFLTTEVLAAYVCLVSKIEVAMFDFNKEIDNLLKKNKPVQPRK